MHPAQLIEWITVGIVVSIIIIVSFVLTTKWRKIGWLLAIIVIVSYSIFYITRPYWIDMQIDRKVEIIQPYLESAFPGETWTISTVPHRSVRYKHLNPYIIQVVFDNEPNAAYQYWVDDENSIFQVGFTTTTEGQSLRHLEE